MAAKTVSAPATNPPPALAVTGIDCEGETLRLWLSHRPDLSVVRRYVTVSPLRDGALGFASETRWRRGVWRDEPCLEICGDFALRTNVTLRVLKGFPSVDRGVEALAEDYTHTFTRPDLSPCVRFTDAGRYLPPLGRRTVAVESVNTPVLETSIRRVEPRNVVQLLAREEEVYRNYWGGSDNFDELSGPEETNAVRCANVPNEREKRAIPVARHDGRPERGIFLVSVSVPRALREKMSWSDRCRAECRRLVCLSDLAPSVRRLPDGVGAWVTSFSTGLPVAGARVFVYSSANILLCEGVTDDTGWFSAQPDPAEGTPFAVVIERADGSDRTFLALSSKMEVDETPTENSVREAYLEDGECTAFLTTERGIYRHDEKILLTALFRDGNGHAPKPQPVEFVLRKPDGKDFARITLMPDARGAVNYGKFTVPAEQPSGTWRLVAKTPGKDGVTLGTRTVRIEEFAPPQIRVRVLPTADAGVPDFSFTVSAEHLFGGPARGLACEAAVAFEDEPFAPKAWPGFRFGNCDRALKPAFRRSTLRTLDGDGRYRFEAPMYASAGLPSAAVRVTAEGTVFEHGGRPATARASVVLDYYPFYVGAKIGGVVRRAPDGKVRIALACVRPDGSRLAEARNLGATLESIETIYTCRRQSDGWLAWDATRVRNVVADELPVTTRPEADVELTLPVSASGDYMLTVTDPATQASFAQSFYLSCGECDGEVRAPLSSPSKVAIAADKPFYRVGDVPRLVVKSPFAGAALLTVARDGEVYSEVLSLTNATCEIALRPVQATWAPNVDVYLSVIQSVTANARHLATRAHGQVTLPVRPIERELDVALEATVRLEPQGGGFVDVDLDARGAAATGAVAVVTLVDEGINLLTDEPVPDPIRHFAAPRCGNHPLYDLYGFVLPVLDLVPHATGVKTGGGADLDRFGRVSPEPSRRFRPLALWQERVPLADGVGRTTFRLPEFVGEVRITAVAYDGVATGSAAIHRKVAPKLVMQPDAPRFAAPGDRVRITLPLSNRSGAAGEVSYSVTAGGKTVGAGTCVLAKNGATNLFFTVEAPAVPGQLPIVYEAQGFGERHVQTIELPIRPAVPWRATAGVVRLADWPALAASFADEVAHGARVACVTNAAALGELAAALDWLSEYPFGCLEQTCSRAFPLVTAGGILGAVAPQVASNRAAGVAAAVTRVASMVRANDFTMWPDCNYAPYDREVSLYAAHFLVAAEKSGAAVPEAARQTVRGFLQRWALSTETNVSVYACHTLALAECPNRDRMFRLYDARDSLSLLMRARLARAFAAIGDRPRAEKLLATASAPTSVREAAFAILARLDLDPDDARLLPLVRYLDGRRDKAHGGAWDTTSENAHALMAIGAYYVHHPPSKDEKYVAWRKHALPALADVRDEANGLGIERRFLDGSAPVDLEDLRCGDLVTVELAITSSVTRTAGDLVLEDLLPAGFEPVAVKAAPPDWVMRQDVRDDRVLVFSKNFTMERDHEYTVRYAVRVVSAGDFVLPGPAVEGMYAPDLRARCAPGRIVVRP